MQSHERYGYEYPSGQPSQEPEPMSHSVESAALREKLRDQYHWQSVGSFNEKGVAVAFDGTDFFFINKDGSRVEDRFSPPGFDWIDEFDGESAWASRNGRQYLVDKGGRIISKVFVESHEPFENDWAQVRLEDGTYTLINRDGRPISRDKFEAVGPIYNGHARVQLQRDGQWHSINTKGKLDR